MKVCECGTVKVDGLCPQCDVRLARPAMRNMQLNLKVKQREKKATSARAYLPREATATAAERVTGRKYSWRHSLQIGSARR